MINTPDKQILETLTQIAINIEADGATEAFNKAGLKTQIKMIQAYLDDIFKKQEQFQTKYLTNNDFKKEFQKLVYQMIKES